ncbi:hypothetical protein GS506_22560 [Rhodococcus hoagii]|nr:hypothetical protein [Prescottella equi]
MDADGGVIVDVDGNSLIDFALRHRGSPAPGRPTPRRRGPSGACGGAVHPHGLHGDAVREIT